MSDIFALGGMDTERSNREALIINSPDVPADLFDGADVTGSWGRGSSRLARAAALAGSVAPMAYDAVFDNGTEAQDWYFKNVVDDPYQSAQEYYAPDGKIVGAGGSVLNSVVEMLPQLVGGGASLTASTQLNTGIDLVNQGVDSMTAQGVGAIQGVAAGAGVWLPVIGKTAAQKVLFSAAANPAINAMARGASNVALESQGYTKQADNYDAFDLQSIAVDTLMGAVFGGVDVQLRGGEAATDWNVIPQSVKDSIVAAKAYTHRTVDSAPGKPMDIKAQNAHLDATDTAVSQMLEGKKVEVADKVEGVEFAPRDMPVVNTELADLDTAVGMPVQTELFTMPEPKPVAVDEAAIMTTDVQSIDPDISQARQAVESYGDYEIEVSRSEPTMGGQVVVTKRKASEVIAEIESAYKTDTQIADAILAASNCFIGGM